MKIKKGDNVVVITGKDKGKTGSVERAFPKLSMVVVAGVNKHKKHERARKEGQKGQVVEKSFPLHVSNVRLADAGGRKTKTKKA